MQTKEIVERVEVGFFLTMARAIWCIREDIYYRETRAFLGLHPCHSALTSEGCAQCDGYGVVPLTEVKEIIFQVAQV